MCSCTVHILESALKVTAKTTAFMGIIVLLIVALVTGLSSWSLFANSCTGITVMNPKHYWCPLLDHAAVKLLLCVDSKQLAEGLEKFRNDPAW